MKLIQKLLIKKNTLEWTDGVFTSILRMIIDQLNILKSTPIEQLKG